MKIGLTYDLRNEYLAQGYSMEETAEFDKESTIAGIEEAIRNAGHQTERIGNAQSLMQALLGKKSWDMVFNIAEGLHGAGRESLVPALLDAYRIPYVFSGPATLACSLNKAFAKRIVRDSGVNTPDFAVISRKTDIDNVHLEYPLFAKPLMEGTGKGISKDSLIRDPQQLRQVCLELLQRFEQPVLVEEFLPGREFTVGVFGSGEQARVPGAMEIIYKHKGVGIYSYENKENFEEVVEYQAVRGDMLEACTELALGSWRALNCLDGGRVDMKIDRFGKMSFIEVNPLAGLNPVISDLPILCRLNGISFQEIISAVLESAIRRNFRP
ncbi:MAG: D-alanine--D-alanine ligase [Candidatus Marinimicrobia bacterium]|nr:D-alanine--D-alanine ligase [Candidatus Neomarinimicrobiota bacterium]MDD3965598.1 D-alanine--D-alanine ligase [Candidatus Neomarinimicrobiota bacterium]